MIYFDKLEFDTDTEYEVYILNKYLTKHYGEESANQLLQAYSSNLDGLAQALGEKDIGFFNLYFMSDTFVVKDSNVARTLAK